MKVPPPIPPEARKRSISRPLVLAGLLTALLLLVAVYYIIDPSGEVWMPKCLFRQLTGWECAGCGSQRLFHALLHGEVREAFAYNPFLFCLLPVIPFLGWLEWNRLRRPQLYAAVFSPAVCYVFGGAIIVWTIGRNLL